ncbi:MAG: uroporphyrinogen decarboxylase family protein [Bacillota bacterium]|nr:uroporphyrinogen decarboxylase family protein [Bacillota bacterium]HPZ54936.1 uroporphyrinogen decarboxylase family protein [Bacillota bacterium]HQD18021.1 uroporphyrinogen decarboxylase family protein [Bacillota bacterium]
MRLIDFATAQDRRKVVPLMAFPGVQLSKYSVRQILFNSKAQVETSRALAERFKPDALFQVMDLSVEANALGLQVRFPLNESPSVEDHPVKSPDDLEQFSRIDILKDGRIMAFLEAMREMKETIDMPIGGYVIGPFTLAGRMMGESEAAMAAIDDPSGLEQIVEFATERILRYGKALVSAGADMIAILEPTGVILSPDQFRQFSGKYVKRILDGLDTMGILHICGDSNHIIPYMCETGAQGLSLDSDVDLPKAIELLPEDVVMIGNLDPVACVAQSTAEEVREASLQLLESMSKYPNFIFSTGCDLPPETPLENIRAMIEACRQHSGA